MNGVYISAGSACSKGHRSNVLQNMGLPPDRIDSAIRISLSSDTSIDEIDRCADVIKSLSKTQKTQRIKKQQYERNNTYKNGELALKGLNRSSFESTLAKISKGVFSRSENSR